MNNSQQTRPPLGLPSGSVRALLTMQIVAVVIVQVIRGKEIEPLWTETLMIALAHYFTSRRFIDLAPGVIEQLESDGHMQAEANPLALPRNSIRVILMAAFIGLAIYLYQVGRLLEPQSLSILGVVFAYLLGILVRGVLVWWAKGRKQRSIRLWEDVKAATVLLVLLVTAGAYLAGWSELIPTQMQHATLGLVLFYFGSR